MTSLAAAEDMLQLQALRAQFAELMASPLTNSSSADPRPIVSKLGIGVCLPSRPVEKRLERPRCPIRP